MSPTPPERSSTAAIQAWALAIVVFAVLATVGYLGWTSSYLRARLFFGDKAAPTATSVVPSPLEQ